MIRKDFIKELQKIFDEKKIDEKTKLSNLNFDSLKTLEILSFADSNFSKLNIDANKLNKCKNISDLVKIFKIKE